ncbi:MAG: PfkB family carbohydrate kinase [Elusimicrobia bacterium]|nr:PfkB family carbohydrate kinase [Elusimicrobiota bacterium]
MSRFDCVCVGVSTVDVLALLDRPLREDEKIAARTIVVDGGGPAGTAACAAASCGLKTAILSFIGRDLWADLLLDGCRSFGVSTRFLQIVPGMATPVSLIAVNGSNASRTILWNNQGAERRRVSLRALARRGFLSLPRAVMDLRRRFGFRVAVTAGEKGVQYFDEARGRAAFIAQKRYPALDTTGCGDVFHGAFLARYLRQRDFAAALRFAQTVAGEKTRFLGGRSGLPRRIRR